MNFKVFGGLLAAVGAVLALIGFPQVFPDFGKSEELLQLERMADATSVSQESIDSLTCFFNDTNCSSSSSSADSAVQVGPALLWGGLALLVFGLIVFASAKGNQPSK